jgi:hypothetical protein
MPTRVIGTNETKPICLLALAVLLFGLVFGCSKTVSEQGAVVNHVESGETAAASGFFGENISLLQPGAEGQAAMVYVNSTVQWSQYNKIMLEPVEFWDSANSIISQTD